MISSVEISDRSGAQSPAVRSSPASWRRMSVGPVGQEEDPTRQVEDRSRGAPGGAGLRSHYSALAPERETSAWCFSSSLAKKAADSAGSIASAVVDCAARSALMRSVASPAFASR